MIPELESLGSVSWAVGATVLLFAAASGLARLVVGRSIAQRWHAMDAALVRAAVGLNVLAFCGMVLGSLGLLSAARALWLLIGLSLLNVWYWPSGRDGFFVPAGFLLRLRRWAQSRFGQVAAMLSIALVTITLGPALCYPVGWDELTYHNALPRRWLADGEPAFYFDLPYSGFPSLGETLFWLVAPLESTIAPRLIGWTCWIIGLVCAFRVLRRSANRTTATALTFAFASAETLLLISANCYVESILLMNVAALFLAVQIPRRISGDGLRGSPVVLLGILAGGAAAIKLTGLAVLVASCLWYAGVVFSDRKRRTAAVRSICLFFLIAIAIAVPFYLRPYLATGNPFYPYFAEWFTNDTVALETSRYHQTIGGADFGVRSMSSFFTAPILLGLDTGAFDGTFGWQLLLLLPLAAIGSFASSRRVRRVAIGPVAIAALWYVFWYATAQQARFAIPAVLAIVIAASLGLQRLTHGARRIFCCLLIAAAIFSIPWRNAEYYQACWQVLIGQRSQTDYVHNLTGGQYLPLVQAVLHETSADAKLMLLFEHRTLYIPRWTVIGTPCFQERGFSPPEKFTSSNAVMELLLREGITHVVAAKSPTGPDKAPGWSDRQEQIFRGLERCVEQGRLRIVWESEKHWLFAMVTPPP